MVFERALAGFALLLCAPLFAVLAVAVALDSRGPIFFRQQRIGRDFEPFTMIKFRSMEHGYSDASHRERNLRELAGGGPNGGPVAHKPVNDPGLTRVGKHLRRYSLDELPQLWNVWRGEMAFVGPRPSLPWEVDEFPSWADPRFAVLPGLTGLWQVSGRNQVSILGMLEMDVDYVRSKSALLDASILVRTLPAVVSATGAA